jgi:hypothetical protein
MGMKNEDVEKTAKELIGRLDRSGVGGIIFNDFKQALGDGYLEVRRSSASAASWAHSPFSPFSP